MLLLLLLFFFLPFFSFPPIQRPLLLPSPIPTIHLPHGNLCSDYKMSKSADLFEKGVALYSEGKYQEAVPILDNCVDVLRKKNKLKSVPALERLTWCANARGRAGDTDGAIKLHQECLEIRTSIGDVGRNYADNLFRLGVIQCDAGKYPDALKSLSDCKALEEKLGQSSEVAFSASSSTLNYLARAMCECGNPGGAVPLSQTARRIQEKLGKTNGLSFLNTLTMLGHALFDAGNANNGLVVASEAKVHACTMLKSSGAGLLQALMTSREMPTGYGQRLALLLGRMAIESKDKNEAQLWLEACRRLGKGNPLEGDLARRAAALEKTLAVRVVVFFLSLVFFTHFLSHLQKDTEDAAPSREQVNGWSMEEVVAHFKKLGVDDDSVLGAFRKEKIDGAALLETTPEDIKGLGVPLGPLNRHKAWLRQVETSTGKPQGGFVFPEYPELSHSEDNHASEVSATSATGGGGDGKKPLLFRGPSQTKMKGKTGDDRCVGFVFVFFVFSLFLSFALSLSLS